MILLLLPFIAVWTASYSQEYPLLLVFLILGLVGLAILLGQWWGSDIGERPKIYRYRLRKRFCPHCDYPYSSVRNQTCVNCGRSLVAENSPL